MSKFLQIYLTILLGIVLSWLWWNIPKIIELSARQWLGLLGISALYIFSHFLRMLRLLVLTLDKRKNAFSLISAHALTALPSSFLPFKFGEILRLASFSYVLHARHKALAVWLVERFGDVLVIIILILSLYLLNIEIPPEMQIVFIIFTLISVLGLFGLFAVTKVFIYLNRHLVLTSLSQRGLLLLRASHALRCLDLSIRKTIEGRGSSFLLLSISIWFFEIIALSLFIRLLAIDASNFTGFFTSGLLASLSNSGLDSFGTYQSLSLVILTVIFLLTVWCTSFFKSKEH